MRALHPHSPIGVQQDVFGAVVFQARGNQRSEFPDQLFVAPFGHLLNFLHPVLPERLSRLFIVLYAIRIVLYIQVSYSMATLLRARRRLVKSKTNDSRANHG